MNYVFVVHAEHGDVYASTARRLLKHQIQEVYSDLEPDVEEVARQVMKLKNQDAAWNFLQSRSRHEHERVSRVAVLN